MIFKKQKYELDTEDKIEYLFLTLFMFIFFSYSLFVCFVGAFMNVGVIMNNDNKMPVLSDCDFSTDRHFSFQNFDEVKYPYLADIIEIKNPFTKKSGMASIGDLMMLFSFLLVVFSNIFFTIKIFKFKKRIKTKYANQIRQFKGRKDG